MKLLKSSVIILVLASMFTACSDDDLTPEASTIDTNLVLGYALSDITENADFAIGLNADDEANVGDPAPIAFPDFSISKSVNSTPNCATATVLDGFMDGYPVVIQLDFGAGCTGAWGYTRTGILTLTFDGPWFNNGSSLTIERGERYTINGFSLGGTVVYLNQTENIETPTWQRTVTNGSISSANGLEWTHSGVRQVSLSQGFGTPGLEDNIYSINSGSHTVQGSNGNTLVATVQDPLVAPYACDFLTQGILNLQSEVLNGELNYGDGTCDNLATYTHSNGQVFTIEL